MLGLKNISYTVAARILRVTCPIVLTAVRSASWYCSDSKVNRVLSSLISKSYRSISNSESINCSSPLRLLKITGITVTLVILSSLTHAQNTEFSTDTQSILLQLRNSQSESNSTSTTKGGVFSKGDVFNSSAGSALGSSTSPVTVLQEVEEKGSASRAFGVVQRQSVAQRVNLLVLFDTDSASIRPESYSLLRSLADALRTDELADQVMAVNGHTDSTGSDDYNLQLSFDRAQSIRDYLVNREGINHSQLKVLGFGEGVPLVTNDTADNRQKNRRVEIERLN